MGISVTPLGVLESGIWTTEFSRSTLDFSIGISSLNGRRPISVMMTMTFFR
jgi:hypothetical protein